MKKVLLIYDDYAEQTATEVYLKKVGFDVVGIGNEKLLSDKLLTFNPDIIVANGKSQRVSSLNISWKLWDNHKYNGKVVVVFPPGVRPSPADLSKMRMDAALESPVSAEKLISTLARFSAQDPVALVEKFQKAKLSDPVLQAWFKVSDSKPMTDQERVAKYQKYLNSIQFDTKQTSFDKQDVKSRQKELKKDWDFDELEKIDELKRQFADALFKKS